VTTGETNDSVDGSADVTIGSSNELSIGLVMTIDSAEVVGATSDCSGSKVAADDVNSKSDGDTVLHVSADRVVGGTTTDGEDDSGTNETTLVGEISDSTLATLVGCSAEYVEGSAKVDDEISSMMIEEVGEAANCDSGDASFNVLDDA